MHDDRHDDVSTQIEALCAELAQLRSEVAELRRASEPSPPLDAEVGGRAASSRRSLLTKSAAAVGAGLVAATVRTERAAAADGLPINQGADSVGVNTTTVTTLIQDNDALVGRHTFTAGSASGVTGTTLAPNGRGVHGLNLDTSGDGAGVRGYTESSTGRGVDGFNGASTGEAIGVRGQSTSATGRGVKGATTTSSQIGAPIGVEGIADGPVNAVGVRGHGIGTDSETIGVSGSVETNGWGVLGIGPDDAFGGGVWAFASGAGTGMKAQHFESGLGIEAESSTGVGMRAQGGRAPLQLRPNPGLPTSSSAAHEFGELYVDTETRQLWYCTGSGTPGTWVNVSAPVPAAPTIGPLLKPVEPFRVYDSRFGAGALAVNRNRVVDVSDAINIESGAVVRQDAVPPGASAVTFNITIFETVGAGFISATPGSAAKFATATVNWAASGTVVGNATLVTLDSQRRMKLFVGGTPNAATGFTIDITGFVI